MAVTITDFLRPINVGRNPIKPIATRLPKTAGKPTSRQNRSSDYGITHKGDKGTQRQREDAADHEGKHGSADKLVFLCFG